MKALKENKDAKLLVVVPKTNTIPPTDNQAPTWFKEFEKKQDERWAKQDERWQKQEAFNQMVLKLFKKHGWIKK